MSTKGRPALLAHEEAGHGRLRLAFEFTRVYGNAGLAQLFDAGAIGARVEDRQPQ